MSERPRANLNNTARISAFFEVTLCSVMSIMYGNRTLCCSMGDCQCSHTSLAQGYLAYFRPGLIILKIA